MAIGLYKYYDDANREYQVSLPDEFASALSYEPADAADPYLPRSISPRYCAYWNQSNNIYRAVVIPSKSSFVAPPQTVTAGGLEWLLSGFYGEQFQQLPGGNMVVLSGVPGEKGDPGASGLNPWQDTALVGNVAISPINTDVLIVQFAVAESGTYLVLSNLQVFTGAAACQWTSGIRINTDPIIQSNGAYGATANRPYLISQSVVLPLVAGDILGLYCQGTVASSFALPTSPAAISGATRLTAIKIGE